MNESDVFADGIHEKEASLSKLDYWLQFEKHTWILGAGIGWLPYQIILTGLAILAIVFSPYMLWQLFKARWYKSVITFSVIVILPFLVSQFADIESHGFQLLLTTFPIITFYGFTYVISYMIGEHLNKLNTLKKWKKEHFINP